MPGVSPRVHGARPRDGRAPGKNTCACWRGRRTSNGCDGGGERGGCGSDLRRRDASGVRVRLFRRRDWGEMTGVYHTRIMAAHVLAAAFLTRTVHAGRCGGGGGGSAAAGRDCVPLWTPGTRCLLWPDLATSAGAWQLSLIQQRNCSLADLLPPHMSWAASRSPLSLL